MEGGKQMTYTINGKEYTEADIKKRCGELMGLKVEYPLFNDQPYYRVLSNGKIHLSVYEPTTNPLHTWPIIEKCWYELMYGIDSSYVKWDYLISKHEHNCTKLVAACICFIEINDGGAK
jgi:hypothetical protein